MNRLLMLLFTTSAVSCSSSSYEDEVERGYLLSFGTEDIISVGWEMIASRLVDGDEETFQIDVAGSSAAAVTSDITDFMLALIPPGTSGSIGAPAPTWVTVTIPTTPLFGSTVNDYDVTYPLDEAFVTYVDEGGTHRQVDGSIHVLNMSIRADDDTADPEGGWRDGGSFTLHAELVDATFSLDDGTIWTLDGVVNVMGETPGTRVDNGGDGDGDGDGDTGGDCSAYAGPEADPQRDVQCQAAWSAQCNGEDKSAYCELYNSSSWGAPGNCPYC